MRLAKWHKKLVLSGPERFIDYPAYLVFFPLALLYGTIARIRVLFYRRGWISSVRVPVPVVSIGNIAVGGTGKTPLTDLLMKKLLAAGIRVAVVSRGYGRKHTSGVTVVCAGNGPVVSADEGGDEPLLLARRNPGAIIIASPDRRRGIDLAIREHSAELILLDDGYQHLKVRRDLDILLLDAGHPFGNGFPMPFGFLREFPSAIERADQIVLTRSRGDESLCVGNKPVSRIRYRLASHAISVSGEKTDLGSLRPGRVGLFAGIADPESFFTSVREAGINPTETLSFADHAGYDTNEKLLLAGLASRCDVLLTTEKDLVKLDRIDLACDLLAVPLELEFFEGADRIFAGIEKLLENHKEKHMLSADLLEILACPQCKGEVSYREDSETIVCEPCKLSYPVRDGIPVMLVDEAEEL